MSKTIKTINSSDKIKFDIIINKHREHGWDLVKNSYSILEDGSYNQDVELDHSKYDFIDYHDNGMIWTLIENYKEEDWVLPDGKKRRLGTRDGKHIRYHEDGSLEYEGNELDNHYHGKCIWWYENGQIKKEINYNKGNEEGLSIKYYENGNVESKGEYKIIKKQGMIEGEQIGGFIDDLEEFDYNSSVRDGKWIYFNKDGSFKMGTIL
tara:strand:- start:162 stop:785 length:624 start_codon:yes stop_codon:yes gene_type:complete